MTDSKLLQLPEAADSISWGGPREDVFTAEQMTAYAVAALAAERERWRDLAQRVAQQANQRGLEGLTMRCTVSETGAVVSWEMDRDLPRHGFTTSGAIGMP